MVAASNLLMLSPPRTAPSVVDGGEHIVSTHPINSGRGGMRLPRPRRSVESFGNPLPRPLRLGVEWLPAEKTAVIKAAGEVDLLTAPKLKELIHDRLRGTVHLLVIDLSEVGFLGSAGLEVLVHAHLEATHRGITLSIVTGTSRPVLRALTAVGLDSRLPLRKDLEEALAHH